MVTLRASSHRLKAAFSSALFCGAPPILLTRFTLLQGRSPKLSKPSLRCQHAKQQQRQIMSPDTDVRRRGHHRLPASNSDSAEPFPSQSYLPLPQLFSDPIVAHPPRSPDPSLINADLEPTLASQRTFDAWHMAALWIGLVVGVPTWYLAGSLVELGMAWWQGLLTVLCGNLLVLFPMVLNGHPGC